MHSHPHCGSRRKRIHAQGSIRAAIIESLEVRRMLSAILYVDASSPSPTHDGSSWSTAYADLQQALAAAVPGDSINVAGGTYKPIAGTNRAVAFGLKSGVAIYSGYAGYGAADPNARDVVAYPTILSGDIGVTGDSSDNSYDVVRAFNVTAAVLDGFTIEHAHGAPLLGGCVGLFWRS